MSCIWTIYVIYSQYLTPIYNRLEQQVTVKSTFVSFFSIVKTRCVLILKILNTCTLSILVYNLFFHIQRNISIHQYFSGPREIEIQIFKKYRDPIGWKNRSDTKNHLCHVFTKSTQYRIGLDMQRNRTPYIHISCLLWSHQIYQGWNSLSFNPAY